MGDIFMAGLAIITAIIIGGVIYIERAFARMMEEECSSIEGEGYLCGDMITRTQALKESLFWEDIRSGPNRLSEKALWPKAYKLAAIRSHDEPSDDAILCARKEILRHVGRAI